MQTTQTNADWGLPGWIVPLMAFSVLMIGTALMYLYANYDRVPNPVPVHFNLSGEPDRFVPKTVTRVFTGGFLASILWMVMAGITAASAYRTPRTERSIFSTKFQAGLTFMISLLLVCVVLSPLGPLPPYSVAGIAGIVLIYSIWGAVRLNGLAGEPKDATPDAAWLWGIIYRNPADSRLVVEKRSGFGYTLNFGHWASWAFLGMLLLLVCGLILLSRLY